MRYRIPVIGTGTLAATWALVLLVIQAHAEPGGEQIIDSHSGHVEQDGTALYYERAGAGQVVLFLHAGVADSRMWDGQFEALAGDYTVVRLDLRGFGQTRLAPGEFSDFDDVAAVMDAVGLETATIVGSSYGAQVAIDFCLAHPDRVEALLISTPIVSGFEPTAELKEFWKAEGAALKGGNLDEAVELNLRIWVDGRGRDATAIDPVVRARIGRMQREVFEMKIPDGVVGRSLDPPAIGRLHDIAVPVLVMAGQYDLQTFIDLAGRVAEEIPNATLITMPTAHMVNMESPAAFNEALGAFLENHGGEQD